MPTTIPVGPVDWLLLRAQRDDLLDRLDSAPWDEDTSALAGVVCLLDSMLDYGHENGLIGEDDEPGDE